jgi:hypothetical protein
MYFLIEPNLVLIYRPELKNYLTLQDILDNPNFDAFEINHSNDFEHFNHNEMHSVPGTSFYFNEEQMKKWLVK